MIIPSERKERQDRQKTKSTSPLKAQKQSSTIDLRISRKPQPDYKTSTASCFHRVESRRSRPSRIILTLPHRPPVMPGRFAIEYRRSYSWSSLLKEVSVSMGSRRREMKFELSVKLLQLLASVQCSSDNLCKGRNQDLFPVRYRFLSKCLSRSSI